MLKGRNKMRVVALISTVLLLVLLVTACGGGSSIVGKWQDPDGVNIEFTSDGKLILSFMGESLEGTYSVSGNKVSVNLMGETSESEFKVSGDTLTLIEPGADPVELTRVK
jgi:hypothetical protein